MNRIARICISRQPIASIARDRLVSRASQPVLGGDPAVSALPLLAEATPLAPGHAAKRTAVGVGGNLVRTYVRAHARASN